MSSSRSSVPATTPKPVSIARHLQLVSSLATAPKTVELPLAECLGLVSAEPVTARLTVPPFTNSAMDGFAEWPRTRRRDAPRTRPSQSW